MIPRRGVSLRWLIGLLILLAASAGVITLTQQPVPSPTADAEVRVVERMFMAYELLTQEAQRRGIEPNALLDPNRTGVIGAEFTELTTTIGNLEAKRTSTQPALAALLVRWIASLYLQSGDPVVITLSGSFPALGIATVLACEELNLDPILVSSIGSSSYGANRENWTWLDMETTLVDSGVFRTRTMIASLGGSDDLGFSYFGDGRQLAIDAIRRNGLEPLICEDGESQWEAKVARIASWNPRLLINVGGNQLAVGPDVQLLPTGLVQETGLSLDRLGLIGWFLDRGLPVIHLLQIRTLAMEYGLPIDPIPFASSEKAVLSIGQSIDWRWTTVMLGLLAAYVGIGWLMMRRNPSSDVCDW